MIKERLTESEDKEAKFIPHEAPRKTAEEKAEGMKIVRLTTAEHDLNALTDYIAEDNPRTALQIFTSIRHTVEKLAAYSFAGWEGRIAGTRALIIPDLPYIVIYTVKEKVIIVAILHTSRTWPTEF